MHKPTESNGSYSTVLEKKGATLWLMAQKTGKRAYMKSEITFLVNGARHNTSGIDPTLTLLAYLRETQHLTGTKEGCGEGDCGACTVVIGELVDGTVRYRAINACIEFIAMLQGRSVWTVEGVRHAGQALHPIQQAFVDSNGTQCGFCTPGFVMSLFAAYLNRWEGEPQIDDLFAGNLCRCTGYKSIVAAAEQVWGQRLLTEDTARIDGDKMALCAIDSKETVVLRQDGRQFFSPGTTDDLVALYADYPDATLVAGATDVGLWVTKQHRRLGTLIYLNRIADLKRIKVFPDHVSLGAAVTHSDALPVLSDHIPAFGELLRRFAAVQVRNSGTVVGNIANGSPIGDTPPALMVLGAQLVLRHNEAQRTVDLDDFFIAYGQQGRVPGEYIESVDIRLPSDPGSVRFYKISKRFDQDISAVCGCFYVERSEGVISRARIAFGGMAATPLRAKAVEAALEGQPWTQETIEAAVGAFDKDFTPISDLRASAEYRSAVSKNLLRRYYLESFLPPEKTQIAGERGFAL